MSVDDSSSGDGETRIRFEGGDPLEEKVWEYDGLIGYRVTGGVPKVAIHWKAMEEPAAELPADEVAKVKRKWQGRRTFRRARSSQKRKEGHIRG